MTKFFTLLLLVLALVLSTCSKEDSSKPIQTSIVATVDDLKISETSFQRSYLPTLLYGDKFDSEKNRAEILNYLIGQKLLAQKGRESHLDTSAHVLSARARIENKSMTRQLYNEWVKKEMEVPTEQELREGFVRGKKGLFVRHLFSESEAEIKDYYRRLVAGEESFYTLSQDVFSDSSLSKSGGALGWITFGDLDETLEDTIYALKVGQISHPVKSQYGWHVLAVDDSQEDVFITEDDFLINKDMIAKKIVERRENLLGKQVLNTFMDNFKIDFNRDISQQVWPLVAEQLNPEKMQSGQGLELGSLISSLEELQDETILTVNGEPWSVEQILKRLPELDRSLLYGNLYVAASNIVRNEMLVREAREMGLENHPTVLEEVQDSQDQIIADTYTSIIADTMIFSHNRQWDYYQTHKLDKYHAPDSLRTEIFGFPDSAMALNALYKIRNANVFTDPGDEIIWLTEQDQNSKIYRLTRSIAEATMAGPVFYQNKWTLVKLLERRRFPLAFEKIQTRVLDDMERERFATTRNILLGGIRPEHQISINYDILNK